MFVLVYCLLVGFDFLVFFVVIGLYNFWWDCDGWLGCGDEFSRSYEGCVGYMEVSISILVFIVFIFFRSVF